MELMFDRYAVDFLPWLLPFYKRHMKRLSNWSKDIRQFIMSHIIDHHRSTLDPNGPPRDFTDALLMHLEEDEELNWEHIIFELEDFLGGHSAIGNLVMLTLAAIVKNPEVGSRIQQEIDEVTGGFRNVNLFDKPNMPYTEATILETLRTSSSPIVPHVANQDTSVGGSFLPVLRPRTGPDEVATENDSLFLFRLLNQKRMRRFFEQLRAQHWRRLLERFSAVQTRKVRHQRKGPKARVLHTLQHRQKDVHRTKTGNF